MHAPSYSAFLLISAQIVYMQSDPKKEIIDIADRGQAHNVAFSRLNALGRGFVALSLDYGFHLENNFGKHKINNLRDNIIYRLESALFHCELLMREHLAIEQHLKKVLANDPQKVLGFFYPKNPNFEIAERKASFIFDSIVFHTASIFDYVSILITFISLADRDQTLHWSKIAKSARDANHEFYKKPVAKTIDRIDRDFVTHLYAHRSELIHQRPGLSENAFQIQPLTGTFNIRFVASPKVHKTFRAHIEKDTDWTVSYFSYWIINKAAEVISELLLDLKTDIEKNSAFPQHTFADGSKPVLIYVDPITNEMQSPSTTVWPEFHKVFPLKASNSYGSPGK